MAQKILQDIALDKELLRAGYVVVPFLNSEEIQRLTDFFYQTHPSGIDGFYASAHVADIGFRNEMNDEIKLVFDRAINQYFYQCTPLGGSFVVKSKSQEERLHPHQDWNIVDEDKFRSFNIWVPLVDLNKRNGAIRILEGSHTWLKNYRGPNIPDGFTNFHEQIWKRMTPLYMKAGEALMYDHRLFHASDPNTTNVLRVAAVFGIISKGTEMYHFIGRNGHVEAYESNLNFFLKENIQEGEKILKKTLTIESPRAVSQWKFNCYLLKTAWTNFLAK